MTLTYTQVWVLVVGCAALTVLIKAFGPVVTWVRTVSRGRPSGALGLPGVRELSDNVSMDDPQGDGLGAK